MSATAEAGLSSFRVLQRNRFRHKVQQRSKHLHLTQDFLQILLLSFHNRLPHPFLQQSIILKNTIPKIQRCDAHLLTAVSDGSILF